MTDPAAPPPETYASFQRALDTLERFADRAERGRARGALVDAAAGGSFTTAVALLATVAHGSPAPSALAFALGLGVAGVALVARGAWRGVLRADERAARGLAQVLHDAAGAVPYPGPLAREVDRIRLARFDAARWG